MKPRSETLPDHSKLFTFTGGSSYMIWNEAVLHYIREALSFFAGAVIQLHAEADAAEAAGRALEIVRALGACDSPANIGGKDFWEGMAGELEFKSPSEASRHIL